MQDEAAPEHCRACTQERDPEVHAYAGGARGCEVVCKEGLYAAGTAADSQNGLGAGVPECLPIAGLAPCPVGFRRRLPADPTQFVPGATFAEAECRPCEVCVVVIVSALTSKVP